MPDIIFGRNACLEALNAQRPIDRVLLEQGIRSDARISDIIRLAENAGIDVRYVPRPALDRLCKQGVHQGVVVYAQSKSTLSLEDLAGITGQKGEAPFYVVLDGIEDPHNLGAILRTCEATGVHGVIIRERRAVGLTPAVLKAAAGAVEYIPLVQVTNIAQAIDALKKQGVWIVGIDSSAKEHYLTLDYRPATAIVVGAEGSGISTLVKKKCDFMASIPMKGKISSLNASVAAAVVLYEVLRQREYQE
jgi:23S rRNA (guanosine2251-2'-O)-methyltransferase